MCTHAEFLLSDGTLRNDGTLECAWHGARFDCRTGQRVPRAGRGSDSRVSPCASRTVECSSARRRPHDRSLADFPLLAANPDLHYLDSAATSQKPRAVLDAMMHYYTHDNANPHRGAYALSARATERYHDARERIARVHRRAGCGAADLHARHDGVAQPRRDGVGTRERAAPATRSSSRDSSTTRTSSRGSSSRSRRGAKLRICDVTSDWRDRPRPVRVAHRSDARKSSRSTTCRTRWARSIPSPRSCAIARRADAVIVCDGAQAAPHFPLDLDSLDVDFYAFSGHKMLGPMGIGVSRGSARAARGDAAVSDGRRHDRVRRRRAHDVERAAAQVRGGHAERGRRRRSRRGVRLSRRARDGGGPRARAVAHARWRRERLQAISGRDGCTARRRRSAAES